MEFLALSHIDLIVFHLESTMNVEEMVKYEDMAELNIGNVVFDAHVPLPFLPSILKVSEISVN